MRAAVGLSAVVVAVAAGCRASHWQRRWGATDDEVAAKLLGDSRVPEPAQQVTRAVTIAAAREDVWRWLIQIGADRGGFYSYDCLENLVGLGIHSADALVPAWQQRAVGDLVAGNAARTAGWFVVDVLPGEALVLHMANMTAGRPVRRDELGRWEFLWTFVLRDAGDGSTRLLVRERVGFGHPLARVLTAPLGPISFVMTRKMMLGIKARAEASTRAGSPAVGAILEGPSAE